MCPFQLHMTYSEWAKLLIFFSKAHGQQNKYSTARYPSTGTRFTVLAGPDVLLRALTGNNRLGAVLVCCKSLLCLSGHHPLSAPLQPPTHRDGLRRVYTTGHPCPWASGWVHPGDHGKEIRETEQRE